MSIYPNNRLLSTQFSFHFAYHPSSHQWGAADGLFLHSFHCLQNSMARCRQGDPPGVCVFSIHCDHTHSYAQLTYQDVLALDHDTMSGQHGNLYPLTPLGSHPSPTQTPSPTTAETTPLRRASTAAVSVKLSKENECGSSLAFALLVFFAFMTVGVAPGTVLGRPCLGFRCRGCADPGTLICRRERLRFF